MVSQANSTATPTCIDWFTLPWIYLGISCGFPIRHRFAYFIHLLIALYTLEIYARLLIEDYKCLSLSFGQRPNLYLEACTPSAYAMANILQHFIDQLLEIVIGLAACKIYCLTPWMLFEPVPGSSALEAGKYISLKLQIFQFYSKANNNAAWVVPGAGICISYESKHSQLIDLLKY